MAAADLSFRLAHQLGRERPGELGHAGAAPELSDNTPAAQQAPAFHFMQALEQFLVQQIGRKALYGGGKVYATLDLADQQAAERASLNAQLPEGATLGIALLDPSSGEVRALVGQKLTGSRPADWNNAVQARRQVGSSIKPLLYTLALSQGWKQSDTVLDSPLTGDYQPQNYDGHWTGRQVTLRYALDHSLNLPTVRLGQEVGMDKFEDKLRDLGMTPPANAGLSLSIGTLEASPLQMAAAYAPFANGGSYYAPSLVRRVEDARGAVIYTRPAPTPVRVWDAQTAWLGLDMIRGVVDDLDRFQGGPGLQRPHRGPSGGGQDRHHQRHQGPVVRRDHAHADRGRLGGQAGGRLAPGLGLQRHHFRADLAAGGGRIAGRHARHRLQGAAGHRVRGGAARQHGLPDPAGGAASRRISNGHLQPPSPASETSRPQLTPPRRSPSQPDPAAAVDPATQPAYPQPEDLVPTAPGQRG